MHKHFHPSNAITHHSTASGTVVLPVMIISVTCATFGSFATITTAAAMSSGFNICARRSADGGWGLASRMGVATSPGAMLVQRMPLPYSSRLIALPSDCCANLLAQYAAPARVEMVRFPLIDVT